MAPEPGVGGSREAGLNAVRWGAGRGAIPCYHDTHCHLVECVMPAVLFPLTPIDYVFTGSSAYPVSFVFHYDYRIDGERLRTALVRIVRDFAPASSRLVQTAAGDYALQSCPEGLVFDTRSQAEPARSLPFHVYLTSVETREDEPLCRIRLTETAEGSTLGVSLSHVVADGFSCFYFLAELARAFHGQPTSVPVLDRGWYQPRTFVLPKPLAGRDALELTGFARAAPRQARAQDAVRRETLLLGAAELAELQAAAVAGGIAGLSLNDALTAHLWKTYVPRWTGEAPPEFASVCLPFDARRFPKWVAGRYFGNGICLAGASLEYERFLAAEPGELAGLVRQAVARVSQEYVRTSYDVFAAVRQQEGLAALEEFHVNDPEGGILVTNLSRVPLTSVDFGGGAPSSFAPVTDAPRTAIVLPAADGLKIEVCYPG